MTTGTVRGLLLGFAGLVGVTALCSLLIGLASGADPFRSVSVGLLLVGSLLFTAGVFTGIRDPRRSRKSLAADPDQPRTWAEAVGVSAVLVGSGLTLVLAGILLDPRTSL